MSRNKLNDAATFYIIGLGFCSLLPPMLLRSPEFRSVFFLFEHNYHRFKSCSLVSRYHPILLEDSQRITKRYLVTKFSQLCLHLQSITVSLAPLIHPYPLVTLPLSPALIHHRYTFYNTGILF
jgi:hypothetical protein